MERKIIKLSTSTHVVSLPTTWMRKNRLKKGAAINVVEQDNKLIISTKGQDTDRKITLDVTALEKKMAWRLLDAGYESGYDSIVIIRKDQDYLSKAGKYFPGMMIYEERKGLVHLKDIAKETKDISKIMDRIFNMVITLVEDSIILLDEKDKESLSKIKKRDTSINSYISYFKRQVTKFHNSDVNLNTYVKLVEMLSDCLCDYIMDKPDRDELDKVAEVIKSMHHLHSNFNQKRLLEFNKRRKLIKEKRISDLLFDIEETQILISIGKLAV